MLQLLLVLVIVMFGLLTFDVKVCLQAYTHYVIPHHFTYCTYCSWADAVSTNESCRVNRHMMH